MKPSRNPAARVTTLLALLALLATPALAAPEHQIILELRFEGSTCPTTLVTVSAQSCDPLELATQLEDELDEEALGGPVGSFCAFSFPDDEYQCVWSPPAGCTQVQERATLETGTGTECTDTVLEGRIFRPVSFGAAIDPRVGLDGQLSNWARIEGRWLYLDVSTPMLRDEAGRDRLDADLFLAALPWVLRAPVRRFLLATITDVYFDPREAMLDVLGNLHKERLSQHIPAGIEVANRRLAEIGQLR